MTPILKLFLLGPPHLEIEGRPVEIKRRKALALLAYLAVTGEGQRRDTLATLLWPEADQGQARAALRRRLSELAEILGGDWLQADWETVRLRPGFWLDLHQFQQHLAACRRHDHPATEVCPMCLEALTAAASLYRADFLTGFNLPDCPDFDEWQFFQTESLRQSLAAVLDRFIMIYIVQRNQEVAIPFARRRLALDPLHEPAHRALMQLYAGAGQQAAALRQYQECVRLLNAELGAQPSAETITLYEALKARRIPEPPIQAGEQRSKGAGERISAFSSAPLLPISSAPVLSQPAIPRHNLPPQPTPFIGRKRELADITRRLKDGSCRLLTLVGPGGIGKTRLAIQAAQSLLDAQPAEVTFRHGAIFVSLASVNSLNGMVSAMAEAANFSFYSNVPPRRQLLDYLREKEMLLLLDNFEHLLSLEESVELIGEILAAAPTVKVLVTSREALNVQEAWFHPVAGLSLSESPPNLLGLPSGQVAPNSRVMESSYQMEVPAEASTPPVPTKQAFHSRDRIQEGVEECDAVQLFVQSARRARVGFSLAAEQQGVIRICRLVAGMPLGIELAAAWLKLFSCDQIADEIERSLDILTSRLQNTPERHRSMRAVFEHSWRRLSEAERDALKRLSVFRGGFCQEAAEAVAEASFMILATLVEKSLLSPSLSSPPERGTEGRRYHPHELLRQFAAEKLQADPSEQEATQDRHSRYYLVFLQERENSLIGKEQRRALAEIGPEIENVRVGWKWAIEQNNIEAIDQALEALYHFYDIRSRYQEGEETFGYAARQWQQSPAPARHPKFELVLTKLLARQGAFYSSLGRFEPARQRLQKSLARAQALDEPREIAFCLRFLGEVATYQGNDPEANQKLQDSLTLNRAIDNRDGIAHTLFRLVEMSQHLDKIREGKRLALESLAVSREIGRQDRIAYALDVLGYATFALGEYSESEQYYRESLAIFEEIGDQLGVSFALGGLGWLAWVMGGAKLAKARPLAEKSLAVCRESGHRYHTVTRLYILGQILNGIGEYEQAKASYQEALALAKALGASLPMTTCLGGLGDISRSLGDFQAGKRYLLEALQIGIKAQQPSETLEVLVYFATLLAKETDLPGADEPAKTEKKVKSLELLVLARYHPACWQVFKDRAARLQAELEAELPPAVVAAAQARGQARDLWATVKELLMQLE